MSEIARLRSTLLGLANGTWLPYDELGREYRTDCRRAADLLDELRAIRGRGDGTPAAWQVVDRNGQVQTFDGDFPSIHFTLTDAQRDCASHNVSAWAALRPFSIVALYRHPAATHPSTTEQP